MTNNTNSSAPAAQTNARTTKHLGHEFNPTETNWSALAFPSDPYGLTTQFRGEFRSMIQRCRGSDEKFRQVLDNLEVLMAWAQVKLEADKVEIENTVKVATVRAEQEAEREEFRARIQAGPPITVFATATGFIEQSPRTGAILATYERRGMGTEAGPVASMAQMMIAEGRDPNSVLTIHAFGRPGIGSGQTLAALASVKGTGAPAQATQGGLQGIRA
ncbi:hypothetical protein [Tabrizicola sp.]|uniref:hypothetical protein n=1 Tax=Tabrizicola sp. TaxID=2005166 RepID=UPI002FDC7BD9